MLPEKTPPENYKTVQKKTSERKPTPLDPFIGFQVKEGEDRTFSIRRRNPNSIKKLEKHKNFAFL